MPSLCVLSQSHLECTTCNVSFVDQLWKGKELQYSPGLHPELLYLSQSSPRKLAFGTTLACLLEEGPNLLTPCTHQTLGHHRHLNEHARRSNGPTCQ